MNIEQFQNRLLEAAKQMGFEEVELYYEKTEQFACQIFQGELDQFETSVSGGLSFRGVYKGKMGSAYTEKLDEDSIFFVLEQAKENASIIEEDEQDEIFGGSSVYEQVDFSAPGLNKLSAAEKIEFLKEVEQNILGYDERIVSVDYCLLSDRRKEKSMRNSRGLDLQEESAFGTVDLSVVVRQGEDLRSGMTVTMTKDYSDLHADDLAREVAEEALSYLGGRSLPNKKYEILFRRDTAARLLQTFIPVFSAEEAQKGRSMLKGKAGSTIGSEAISIVDDPFHPDGYAGRNFDGEGVASKKQSIVQNGVLTTLLHNRKTAKKDGVETTGHAYKDSYKGTMGVAPSNFFIVPGSSGYESLVASIGEGIIVTGLSGLHSGADSISGDFSVAASGYYVKDGKNQGAVKQMTIAGNFYQLLRDVKAAGSDLEFQYGGVGSPALLVKELSVTVE